MYMRIRQVTVAAGVALLLTACGGSPLDGKNGSQVADAAADALEKAGAVHIKGTIDQDGEKGGLDLHLQGDDSIGSITLSGVKLQLVSVDGKAYLQAPGEYWTSAGLPAQASTLFADKWVIVPAAAAEQFSDFSLKGLVDQFRNPDTKIEDDVSSDEVDGKDVVVVKQKDGGTLSVADDEPAYPLQLENKGDSTGTITFSRFGEKKKITAPADALDLEALAGS
jgi:hypothetical protein